MGSNLISNLNTDNDVRADKEDFRGSNVSSRKNNICSMVRKKIISFFRTVHACIKGAQYSHLEYSFRNLNVPLRLINEVDEIIFKYLRQRYAQKVKKCFRTYQSSYYIGQRMAGFVDSLLYHLRNIGFGFNFPVSITILFGTFMLACIIIFIRTCINLAFLYLRPRTKGTSLY